MKVAEWTTKFRFSGILILLMLSFPTASSQTWRDLLKTADSLSQAGNQDSAIIIGKLSLKESRALYGLQDTTVALVLNRLGVYYHHKAAYWVAESLYYQALNMREKLLGKEHLEVAKSLSNMALLRTDQYRYSEAETLLTRALTIMENKLGNEHPFVAWVVTNLANVKSLQGEYSQAVELQKLALEIKVKILGPEHLDVAVSLNNIANIYLQLGRFSEAEQSFKKALAINEKQLGADHPDVALNLHNLTKVYLTQGQYNQADSLLKRALPVYEKQLGEKHPRLVTHLELHSKFHRLKRNFTESLAWAKRATEIRIENFQGYATTMSERNALQYSHFMKSSLYNYLSCLMDGIFSDKVSARSTGDLIFTVKGAVSDEIFERSRALITESDSVTLSLLKSYQKEMQVLSGYYFSDVIGRSSKDYKNKLDSLLRLTDGLENQLAHRSASFTTRLDLHNINTARIAELIPPKTVLLEYLKYTYTSVKSDSSVAHYLVLVLDRSAKPSILELGEAQVIDNLIEIYRRHLQEAASKVYLPGKKSTEAYKLISKKLYQLVWQPAERLLPTGSSVFIAPDGGLNLVSFAGLTDNEGVYLVEKYKLHYLSAARDLMRLQEKPKDSKGLVALADPDLSPPSALLNLSLAPLPQTRTEVEQVTRYWCDNTGQVAITLLGAEASEKNFKIKTPGNKVIHLATHGFFLADSTYFPWGKSGSELSRPSIEFDNPLLLSGMLLSSTDHPGKSSDTRSGNDGILTAEEIATMDLDGTQLVVLSACETGLGKVWQGEGVYGLRRAFQMAGARTVISALWKVPDANSTETMKLLYSLRTKSMSAKLQEAQLAQLHGLRKKGDPDHPYSWAGFVAIGDWRE